MATVKATLTLSSTDLTTDSLSTSVTTTLTGINTGGIHIKRYIGTNAGSSQELGEENAWAGTVYVYMRNASTVGNISVLIGSGSTSHILLAPGEWAFIPWRADDGDDIDIFQSLESTVGCLLEYGLYGA